MNWNDYLLNEKAPIGTFAHLGVLEGTVQGVFDLSELPENTKVLDLSTPLKKFKLKYTNLDSLKGNKHIKAISLNDVDEERIVIFSTLPNLKYLKISNNQQTEIPDLSCLQSLEVLILANIKKVENIDFISRLKNLKTLYIYGFNHLYDLSSITSLKGLEELFLDHGKMSGTGKAIKSIEPISKLSNLNYLHLSVAIENKNYDITPLLTLKQLQKLFLLPRYLADGQKEVLQEALPKVKIK